MSNNENSTILTRVSRLGSPNLRIVEGMRVGQEIMKKLQMDCVVTKSYYIASLVERVYSTLNDKKQQ